MENTFYDVIIIGGGPAGSSAAYFLTQGGKRVLVLERERLPRYKTCGGGLSVRFLREQFPFSFHGILKTEVNAITYAFYGQMVTIPLRRNNLGMVMRADLDGYLLARSGARVIAGALVCKVEEGEDQVIVETKDGGRYAAAYAIGADGANSIAAHSVGLRARRVLGAAVEAEVDPGPEIMRQWGRQALFIFGEIRGGYAWIFPKPDHLSIGIASYRPKPGELQRKLRKIAQRYGIALDGADLKGHPIPVFTRREQVATRRVLLAGDAAGLVDPLSGEGIRFAIKSGRCAAEAILSGRPERYPDALFRAVGVHHLFSLLIAWFFYTFPWFFLFLGAGNPFSTQVLLDMLADHAAPLELILWGALTMPVFALTEAAALLLEASGRGESARRLRAAVYPEAVGGG